MKVTNKVKAQVVQADECERSGERQVLNFGHTVAHAIEAVSDYSITHGDAVRAGLWIESGCTAIFSNVSLLSLSCILAFASRVGLNSGAEHWLCSRDTLESAALSSLGTAKTDLCCLI